MKNPIKKVLFLYVMLALMLFMSMCIGVLTSPATVAAQTEIVNISSTTISNDATDIGDRLTPDELKAAIDKLSSVNIYSRVVDETTTRGSNSVTIEVYSVALSGQKLWSYYQRIDWSYSGGQITSVTRYRWGTVYQVFWSFEGHIGNTESGGVGQSYYQAWTQGKFVLNIGGWVVQTQYPWIDMTVYGNGNYTWTSGA